MIATAEIDKAGRLVVPKKMRDALHLVPGTRVTLSQTEDAITIAPELKPRGLYLDRGTLVYDAGPFPPVDVVAEVRRNRDDRLDELATR